MKSLREVIDEAGEKYDTKTIMLDFTAYVEDRPVIVSAILDLTAVVHPSDVLYKSVVNLNKVMVKSVEWVDRAKLDTQTRQARRRGRYFSHIARTGGRVNGSK